MTALRFHALTLAHRQHLAVVRLSGTLARGSLTAIVGPNGAGKSSLLDALAGRMAPAGGHIEWAPGLRGQAAYLPQQAQIDRSFPLRVLDLVMLGHWRRLGAWRAASAAQRAQAADALGGAQRRKHRSGSQRGCSGRIPRKTSLGVSMNRIQNHILDAARAAAVLACLSLSAAAQAQGHAHEHGAVKLDIAVEAGKLTLQMESPLANLVGFERSPRTDAERKKVADVVAQLKAADTLFKIDPAAGCTLAKVELASAVLKLGTPDPSEKAEEGHADIDGDFEYTCTDSARAAFIELGLFGAFKNMQRIDVQVAAPKGQAKRTLKRPASRVTIPR
jgi:energy-coupling factor transporter ATP-binding protein EcfA2